MIQKRNSFSKTESYEKPSLADERAKYAMPEQFVEFPNWYEIRPVGAQPERRGFHTSFVYDNKMFMFGGRDTEEGFFNKIWALNLSFLAANEISDCTLTPQWTLTELQNKNTLIPPAVSHHSAVVYQN